MKLALRERLKASGIHLLLSAVVFAIAVYLIACVWYPSPLFNIAGGWQGIRIMLLVDIVLGPLLTLLVFDRSKGLPRLQFDMAVIVGMQVTALSWGFYAVHSQRPLASVYWDGEFNILVTDDYAQQDATPVGLDRFGEDRPLWLMAREPANPEEETGLVAHQMVSGLMPWQLDFLLQPLDQGWSTVTEQTTDPEMHLEKHPEGRDKLNQLTAEAGGIERLRCFKVMARYGSALLVFNEEGDLLGALPGADYDTKMFGLF